MIRDNYFYNENEDIAERYGLVSERVRSAIAEGGLSDVPEEYRAFFAESGEYLGEVFRYFDEAWGDGSEAASSGGGGLDGRLSVGLLSDEAYLRDRQAALWKNILPSGYETSFLNPAVAVGALGQEIGGRLSMVYADLTGCNGWLAEGRRDLVTIFSELWIELLCICEEAGRDGETDALADRIALAIYDFYFDTQAIFLTERAAQHVDADCDRIRRIVTESDLSDTCYLYEYGAYIGENELRSAHYLYSLSDDKLQAMADTLTEGYRIGFEITGRDLSKKKTAELCFPIGFEPMVRRIIANLGALGLSVTARPEGTLSITGRGRKRAVYSTSANKQFDYDHKDDRGYIYDRAFAEERVRLLESAYEAVRDKAAVHAGPAVIEVFGEPKFTPINKKENYEFASEQNELNVYEASESGRIINTYIPGEERSFSIIAYPLPCIGEEYEAIFDETVRINTLDYMQYREIQQHLIDALDKGERVHVVGCGENVTDITVQLHPVRDPERETKFENCVADVNIPAGEVFTSPVLEGTEGTLFVSRVYLGDYTFEGLRFDFKDGKVVDYTCKNFPAEEENRKFIFDRILYKHETLPIGEFAIGTNTTAYIMARRFGISDKLPILIAEKTGPHFALGDTCYDHAEDVTVYNPDGKEIIARENSCSALRNTDPAHAYFNCHTDITIPFEELGLIEVVCADGSTIELIRDGRFVLPETEALNEPLDKA